MTDTVTQEELKQLLSYDFDSGLFNFRTPAQGRQMDKPAGTLELRRNGKRYWAIEIRKRRYLAHRLAWLYVYGSFPEKHLDHIDGDGLNNKIGNLREVVPAENLRNKRKYINNKSGITGVCWDKSHNKWEVQIRVDQKTKRIGRFDNLFDAACARVNANIRYGYHDNHGSDRPL